MPRTCRSAPVITTAPIPCSFRISAASQSVAVGLIVTTSLPLWDRIALTVMGILREHRRPLYRNLELCVGETAPREPFDNRRLPCPLISSPSATLNALIKSKAARRGQGILRPRLAQRHVPHPHLYGRGDGRSVTLGSALKAWLGLSLGGLERRAAQGRLVLGCRMRGDRDRERVPDDVSELRPGAKQRSLHAVLVESLTNTK